MSSILEKQGRYAWKVARAGQSLAHRFPHVRSIARRPADAQTKASRVLVARKQSSSSKNLVGSGNGIGLSRTKRETESRQGMQCLLRLTRRALEISFFFLN